MPYSLPLPLPLAAALPLLLLVAAGPARALGPGVESIVAARVQAAMEAVPDAPPGPRRAGLHHDGPHRGLAASAGDPWEGMNRKVFAFNETVDIWVLEPVATGWDFVVPELAQQSIGNFFDHLRLPVKCANDLLQAKPWLAYATAWRFVINSVVGIGGLFDPASHWEVHESDEDFGQTLGYWGVPPGPYWVIPLLGPSSVRDAAGLAVDLSAYTFFVLPLYVTVPATAVDTVNSRAMVLEDVRAEREAAFDFYTFVRSSYTQYRENQVRDRAEDEEDDADDLYHLDEEDDADDLYHLDEEEDEGA